MTQSSRELVNALLRKGQPERVGLTDGPWADSICAWVKDGYPTRMEYKEVGETFWRRSDGKREDVVVAGEYEEPVPPWEHFGYDLAGCGGFAWLPLHGYSELVEETDEWEVKRNGAGASFKYWKHKSGTPEHVDFRMSTREIWERDYRPHLLPWDPERVDLRALRKAYSRARQHDKWAHFGQLFIWEGMRQSMGDVTMYESLVLDPGWVHDFNRVYTDMYKRYYAYMFERVGLPDGIWLYEDLGYKNGLFASPRVLKKLIFPYFAEIVEFFHSYDLPVVLHTCGSVAAALDMIVDAGFDALNPMERKAKDNEPFVFAEKYGDKLAFIGGLDVRVFETNDPVLIRSAVVDYIEGMKARGARLVFASDHSIPPTVRYDTYRMIVDIYHEHMCY